MTSLQPFSLPPRWLPLRLLLGGMIVAVLLLLAKHHSLSVLYSCAASVPGFWARCGSSLIVLALGLSLALCLALIVGLFARQLGPRMEWLIAGSCACLRAGGGRGVGLHQRLDWPAGMAGGIADVVTDS